MFGRSQGRVCVLGEHCDWAGVGSSLTAPVQAGIEVQIRNLDWGLVIHSARGVSRVGADGRALHDDPNRYCAAVARELSRRGHPLRPARMVVRSDLPIGRGFSSSAALCVATARALSAHNGLDLSKEEVVDVAFAAESQDLGIGIGRMDPMACAAAEPLHIRWAPEAGHDTLQPEHLPLLAAAFPEPRPAEPILAALANARGRADVEAALTGWGQLAEAGAAALRAGDLAALGQAMNDAQDLYDAIDLPELAAPQLRVTRAGVLQQGALGAKFSGAGGDRSLVALFSDDTAREAGRVWLEAQGLEVLNAG